MIEGKAQVGGLSVKFFNQPHSLVITFIEGNYLIFVWIEFLYLLFNSIVGTESRYNLDALLISFVHIGRDLRLLIPIGTFVFVLRVVSILRILGLRLLSLLER